MRISRVRVGRSAPASIKIVERYIGYTPPVDAVALIRKAARVIPVPFLRGINSIILTNGGAMSRRRRRAALRSRKHKVLSSNVLGLYQRRPGRRGEIELFVDRIVGRADKLPSILRREFALLALGSVLFHEVGHHIDFTKRPALGECETTAERYEALYFAKLKKRRRVIICIGLTIGLFRMIAWMIAHPVESWYRIQCVWLLFNARRSRLELHANA